MQQDPWQRRVLLISAPWQTPEAANLGLSTLRSILCRAGIETDELHGAHLFPAGPSHDILRLQYSAFFFLPCLHAEVSPEQSAEAALRAYLDDCNLQGVRLPRAEASFAALGLDEAALRRAMLEDIERAAICIERCVERAAAPHYDVVGLSCTFETQVPAALAIAARLRQRRPEVRLVLGGAACHGEPAAQMLRWAPALDAVCHTEGDQVVVPLVRALRGELPLGEVPGIVWRDGAGAIHRTPSPPLLTDLDRLPIPDYDPFVSQLAASEWGHLPPRLYFETSRGCWWGQKHLCTFCGLNAEGLRYRRKSPERVVQELRTLHERYPMAPRLYATDNILDLDYLQTVLPHLEPLAQRPGRPLRLFFEIKSSLRREQVRQLAAAGVDGVQPGIESFDDDVLALMDKGATGLGQVQHLKWLVEEGIQIVYNILLANPGEQARSYQDMCRLLPAIEHLPPPTLASMWLERFSPYFNEPARYGIRNVRARAYYAALCRAQGVDLDRLAYVFDYDHACQEDAALRAALREFARRVDEWNERWQPDRLFYRDAGSHVVIVDRRQTAVRAHVLSGTALAVFRYLDRVRPLAAIRRKFSSLSEPLLETLLDTWLRRRWLCRDGKGRHLVVVPRRQLPSAIRPEASPPA